MPLLLIKAARIHFAFKLIFWGCLILQRRSLRNYIAMTETVLLPHSHLEKKHPPVTDGAVLFNEREVMRYYQQRWKDKVGYGRRTSVERSYSTFKALFGGYASSRKWKSLRKEMLIKCPTYNKLLEIR